MCVVLQTATKNVGRYVDSSTPIQSDCSMCGFGTSLVGTGPYAKTVYVRQCTKVGGVSGLDGISSCHSSDVSGIKMNVCICTSDLCNASEAKTLASGPGQTSSGTGKFLGANEVAAKVSVKLFIAMLSTIVFAF
ncbi:hypothetical protein DPMN_150072 [Dreissena polymorpha]|uniref:Uncharacterized protein n=1 Tax=Dreissena polymorpha TaxID=45954 RepID=A0A9D4J5L6_DREPO|nr:hypothetical protein DPMN_150072 [Dreissena polymorpha]